MFMHACVGQKASPRQLDIVVILRISVACVHHCVHIYSLWDMGEFRVCVFINPETIVCDDSSHFKWMTSDHYFLITSDLFRC